MNNRQKHQRRLPLAHRPKNTVSSSQTPLFAIEPTLPQPKPKNRSFRVPSPTDSEEEEVRLCELESTHSEHLSGLGDSSSLFSPRASTSSPEKAQQATTADFQPFQFVGSSPAKTSTFTFTSSPPSTRGFPDVSIPNWSQSSATIKDLPQKWESRMVVEREPPKAPPTPQRPSQPVFGNIQQPEFGKASPLQNRLHTNNVFNIPKSNQARPEHHRPAPAPNTMHQQQAKDPSYRFGEPVIFQQPTHLRPNDAPRSGPEIVEIPRPANHPTWTTKAPPQPTFSSFGNVYGWAPVNPSQRPGAYVDLTKPQENVVPDSVIFGDKFGAVDPYNYIEAGKATENIKALLEGAFEDEEDKPRTRGRKKKVEAAVAGLADKVKELGLKADEQVNEKEEADGEDEEDVDDGTVEGLEVKLLPHQVDGVEWMRDKEIGVKKKNGILPKGGILADDMGLGKTIQSIALLLTNPRPAMSSSVPKDKKAISNKVDKGTLVVAPLALIKQWEAEIKNRVSDTHQLRVCIHHGPQRTKRFEDLRKYDVVITTYQILVSEHGNSSGEQDGLQVGCFGLHWYRVLLDEAHTIKNRNAKATKACYALRAEYRWCLTGTPMQNNLDELQSLIKFLRIKPYNDLSVWKDQITRPMSNGRGGVAIKRLQFYLKAFMKRRTKDILKQEGALNPGGKPSASGGPSHGFKLVERKIENVEAEFTPEERRFYDRLEQRADESLEQMMGGQKMNYASALVLLLRLRQACNHPKLVGGSMANDKDALTTGEGTASQTPRKAKVADKELDDMADLLGGLSVETKKCDVCQIELARERVASGSLRCEECEEDLATAQLVQKPRKSKSKKHRHKFSASSTPDNPQHRIPKNRQVILDDSDEEEDGDWLIPEDRRHAPGMGKAGGSDDENAEGGGESLASSDTDTDTDTDDEAVKVLGSRMRKVINHNSSDDPADSASESAEQDEESSSSDDETLQMSPTTSAKISHLLAILKRDSPTHKFIVFSQFTSMLDLIEPFLHQQNLVFTRYDGSMRNDHREASLERLRTDSKTRVLLCSLKCGSLGLNLTAASRVVILEPFWNPFVEDQAIDRVHRLNQTTDVIVYKLTIARTVEARILALQEKKRKLAEAAIEGKAVGKLSMKDILNLFRREAENEDGHGDGGVGGEVRVLSGGGEEGRGGWRAEVGDVRDQIGVVRGLVREKGRVGVEGATREDKIYGRRW